MPEFKAVVASELRIRVNKISAINDAILVFIMVSSAAFITFACEIVSKDAQSFSAVEKLKAFVDK